MTEEMNIPLENLLGATGGSIFQTTILAAKRAMLLADGDKPLIARPGEKVLDNAFREIEAGKIKIKQGA